VPAHRAPLSKRDTFFAGQCWADCIISMSALIYDRHNRLDGAEFGLEANVLVAGCW
jgi:hypothetical protein